MKKINLSAKNIERLCRAFERIRKRAKEIAINAAGDDKFDVYFKTTSAHYSDVFFDVEGSNTDTFEWIRDVLIDTIKDELRWQGIGFGGVEDDGNREGVFWILAQFIDEEDNGN